MRVLSWNLYHGRPDPPRAGLRFRRLLDEFAAALDELEREATAAPTAFCCAEALWWQCHRRLIADRLTVQGWTVLHIDSGGHTRQHALPDFARVEGGRLVYDVGVTLQLPS